MSKPKPEPDPVTERLKAKAKADQEEAEAIRDKHMGRQSAKRMADEWADNLKLVKKQWGRK